jgi:hypothetical protein
LKKEKDLLDKLKGTEYKHLNRVLDITNIKYGERPALAYSCGAKPGIENVTRKKRGGPQLTKKVTNKKKLLLMFHLRAKVLM